ncbi:hypothetical protein Hypma_006699 [Hypsizygus marmoreus]|uniref:Uncharacterized protein n=1 Tax=Hypsizygus marmoreus TaxID=39966 RepID=A0A369K693_HYPMA|nr:hypothetical protein Hypma_006699 [Hypsizygus marmoreus]
MPTTTHWEPEPHPGFCLCDFLHTYFERQGYEMDPWDRDGSDIVDERAYSFTVWDDCDGVLRFVICHSCGRAFGLFGPQTEFRGYSSKKTSEPDSEECLFCKAVTTTITDGGGDVEYLGRLENYVLPRPQPSMCTPENAFTWWWSPEEDRTAVRCSFCDSLWGIEEDLP